jgi:hypothetical protein
MHIRPPISCESVISFHIRDFINLFSLSRGMEDLRNRGMRLKEGPIGRS